MGNHSIKTLADWLYEKGHRTRRGGKISIQTLHGILRNRVYIGLINLNGRDAQGTHKPLIKKALFEKVQKRLQETGHEHPEQGKEYYFKGLAKCGYCGRSLVAETHKGIAYYHCSRIGCKQAWIREEEFIKRFDILGGFDQEEDAFKVFEAIKEALRNAGHIEQEEIKTKLMKIQKLIAVLEGQIDMIYDDRLKGDISAERYKRKTADIEERQRQLRAKAEETQETNHEFLREGMDLLDITEQIYKRIRTFDKEQLQVLTRQVLESVTAKHGELYWKYKSPFDLLFDIHRGKHPRSYAFSTNIFDRFRRSPIDPMLAGLRGLL